MWEASWGFSELMDWYKWNLKDYCHHISFSVSTWLFGSSAEFIVNIICDGSPCLARNVFMEVISTAWELLVLPSASRPLDTTHSKHRVKDWAALRGWIKAEWGGKKIFLKETRSFASSEKQNCFLLRERTGFVLWCGRVKVRLNIVYYCEERSVSPNTGNLSAAQLLGLLRYCPWSWLFAGDQSRPLLCSQNLWKCKGRRRLVQPGASCSLTPSTRVC